MSDFAAGLYLMALAVAVLCAAVMRWPCVFGIHRWRIDYQIPLVVISGHASKRKVIGHQQRLSCVACDACKSRNVYRSATAKKTYLKARNANT